METKCLDIYYLDIWTNDFINLISKSDHFEKFASRYSKEMVEYEAVMNIYWKRVKSHCNKLAQKPLKNIDDKILPIINHMKHKINWLQTSKNVLGQPTQAHCV